MSDDEAARVQAGAVQQSEAPAESRSGPCAPDRVPIEPSLVRRRATRRRDPRSPVLNMHAPHTRLALAGRRSQHTFTSSPSVQPSLSSDDGAARLSFSYTDQRSRRYNTRSGESSATVGAHASALGSSASEEWLAESSRKLGHWAASVEQEQEHRREVQTLHADTLSPSLRCAFRLAEPRLLGSVRARSAGRKSSAAHGSSRSAMLTRKSASRNALQVSDASRSYRSRPPGR